MIKKFLLCVLGFASFSTYAASLGCSQALPTSDPNFCPSFRSVAECHCVSRGGLPKEKCKDMDALYNYMISIFGTLKNACNFQHDTDAQTCIDDWTCYRDGGKDSHGKPCSSTGRSCR